MQHHMPAASLDTVHHAVEYRHVRRATEMLDEIEAHSPHAATIEPVVVGVGKAVGDNRNTAVAFRVGRKAIEHRRIVAAVAACLHNHRALDAEVRMQRGKRLLRRVLRRIAAVGRIGKTRGRPEHVTMRVARKRGQLEYRLAPFCEIDGHDFLAVGQWQPEISLVSCAPGRSYFSSHNPSDGDVRPDACTWRSAMRMHARAKRSSLSFSEGALPDTTADTTCVFSMIVSGSP